MRCFLAGALCLVGCWLVPPAISHVAGHASVHDTVAALRADLVQELTIDELRALTPLAVIERMSADERHVLSHEHISFNVNVPIRLTILRDMRLRGRPFWLTLDGYRSVGLRARIDDVPFDAWEKDFDAGTVGLGVNSLASSGLHYAVLIEPRQADARVETSDMYPGYHTIGVAAVGERPYTDADRVITHLDVGLAGRVLLRTANERRDDGRLIYDYRVTRSPATSVPDQVVLTWSEDPRTTQTLQWRTDTSVGSSAVYYATRRDYLSGQAGNLNRVDADLELLETPYVANDPVVHRFSAVLRGLHPGTTYLYAVGDGSSIGTTEFTEFSTAPTGSPPFKFVYMGDAQNGLDTWGTLIHDAFRRQKDAAFYIMAGDLVNRGNDRDDWDDFFTNSEGVFDRRPLVPVPGNHEYQGGRPTLYLKNFRLPENGPAGLDPEHAYVFEYGNAIFIMLDSNLPPESQASWIDEQLAQTDATWRFVVFHHPAFSSHPRRNNAGIREVWTPIFDKYHVDMVLQGHDHAYLRTYPMKGMQPVEGTQDGTVYVVSVSGVKMYEQGDFDYTQFGMTNVSTYQLLDIRIDGDRMVYRAYDVHGVVRDEFVIDKTADSSDAANPLASP